jgi:hypothetical protein
MTVYVLSHIWDTGGNEGSDILGVYDSLEKAQDKMLRSVESVKNFPAFQPQSSDEDPVWDDDYCWQDADSARLGFASKTPFMSDTVYSWDIYTMEVE